MKEPRVKSLNDKSFKAEIIDYTNQKNPLYEISKNTVVEFYNPDCRHCIAMEPIVEEAAKEFPDIDFFRVNVTEHEEPAAAFNIDATPTFVFIKLKGNLPPYKVKGQMGLESFRDTIKRAFE